MEPIDLYILSLGLMITVIGLLAILNNRTREQERKEKEMRTKKLIDDLVISTSTRGAKKS